MHLKVMWTMAMKLFLLHISCTYHMITSVAKAKTSSNNVCQMYLAPSLTPGNGRGVFAGLPIKSADVIESAVTIAFEHSSIHQTQLNNYVWSAPEENISTAEFGPGMLFNHRNPPLVQHERPYKMKKASDQRHAHTTSSPVLYVAERDIYVGEEIFVSYGCGDNWLEDRGIEVAVESQYSNAPKGRSVAELEAIGHCLTDVKVYNKLKMFLTVSLVTQ
jgi:hypothetical protein